MHTNDAAGDDLNDLNILGKTKRVIVSDMRHAHEESMNPSLEYADAGQWR